MPNSRNLFLAFTPYHVILSYAVAADFRNDENELFVISDFPGSEKLATAFLDTPNSPFKKIVVYPGSYTTSSKIKRRLMTMSSVYRLKNYVKLIPVSRVFVTHDIRAESQVTMRYARKKWMANCYYIEDGASVYSSARTTWTIKSMILNYCFYGLWYEHIPFFGLSSWIEKLYVIYPSLVRDELRKKPITAIKGKHIMGLSRSSFDKYLYDFDISITQMDEFDVLILLKKWDIIRNDPDYLASLNRILYWSMRKNFHVAMKYHPLEKKQYLEADNINNNNIIMIPQEMPVELLYTFKPRKLRFVLSHLGTSGLITATWLLPSSVTVLVFHKTPQIGLHLLKCFRRLGIQYLDFSAMGSGKIREL